MSTLSGHHASSVLLALLPAGAGSLMKTWCECALTSPGVGGEHCASTAGSHPPHPPALELPKLNKRPTAASIVGRERGRARSEVGGRRERAGQEVSRTKRAVESMEAVN